MIEFAPNPSGPAHIGTLRTYAVAWEEATRTGQTLFVRFDAYSLKNNNGSCAKWAQHFLGQLKCLNMMPTGWEIADQGMTTASLPDWAIVKEIKEKKIARAYYTDMALLVAVSSPVASAYRVHAELPLIDAPIEAGRWNFFAEKTRDASAWSYHESVINLIRMNLRSVTAIVRSHISGALRSCYEEPAHRHFGLGLPEEIRTSVVVDDAGALRKSMLRPGDVGTVDWALKRLGSERLRNSILTSVHDDNHDILHIDDVLG